MMSGDQEWNVSSRRPRDKLRRQANNNRNRKDSSVSVHSSEINDDYDSQLYGDSEDQEYLKGLPELQREQVLHKRHEEREARIEKIKIRKKMERERQNDQDDDQDQQLVGRDFDSESEEMDDDEDYENPLAHLKKQRKKQAKRR